MNKRRLVRRLPVVVGAPTAAVTLAVAFAMPASATPAASASPSIFHNTTIKAFTGSTLPQRFKDLAGTSGSTVRKSAVTPKDAGTTGGWTSATSSDEPSAVQIAYAPSSDTDPAPSDFQFCAGALIAPAQVVTSASCVSGMNYAGNPNVIVWQGSDSNIIDVLANGGTPSGEGTGVLRQWVDPNYSASNPEDNAVAVLTLDAAIGTGAQIATAGSSSYASGTQASEYSWADTDGTFQTASLPLTDAATCQTAAGSGYVAADEICGGDGSTTGAICPGDDGDPVFVGGQLVGVETINPSTCQAQGTVQVLANLGTYWGPLNDWAESSSIVTGIDSSDNSIITNGLGGLDGLDSSGDVYDYGSTGSGQLTSRFEAGTGFTNYLLGQFDIEQSGITGLLTRDNSSGILYYQGYDSTDAPIDGTGVEEIGSGWNIYNMIVPLGNVAGAPAPDLVARDSSGELWLYLGYGNGKFAARAQIGAGWNAYNLIVGDGDFNGDGYADLIARDTSGKLWYYQGTGNWKAPFKPRVQIGYDYQIYSHMAVINNFMGNGLAALVGADSSGDLYVYTSTGSSTSPLSSRVKIGYDYQIYSNLF